MVSGPRTLTNTATASASGVHQRQVRATVEARRGIERNADADARCAAAGREAHDHQDRRPRARPVQIDAAVRSSPVANAGPATAKSPTVTDRFSTAASIVSAHPSSGSCPGHNPLTCTLGSIGPGAHATIVVTARPQVLGTIRNSATVTTSTPLAPGSRTMAYATTEITTGVHTWIALTDRTSTSKIPPGGKAAFGPKVTNPNPWPLHNVKACDRLPAGTMFVSASQGATRSGQVVCWALGTLAPHALEVVPGTHAETLLGVAGKLRDAASAEGTGGGHHSSAHAHTDVLVTPTGRCGRRSLAGSPHLPDPLAVAAC